MIVALFWLILGMLLFDAVITAQSAAYIAVSMAGGFIYTYVKLMESRAAKESSSSPSKR